MSQKVKKLRSTGFRDKNGKELHEGNKVHYWIDYLEEWVRGRIIFRDDIPRVAHKYGMEIINIDVADKIKKIGEQYEKRSRV